MQTCILWRSVETDDKIIQRLRQALAKHVPSGQGLATEQNLSWCLRQALAKRVLFARLTRRSFGLKQALGECILLGVWGPRV